MELARTNETSYNFVKKGLAYHTICLQVFTFDGEACSGFFLNNNNNNNKIEKIKKRVKKQKGFSKILNRLI